jgi:hypothetical protein
MDSNDHHRATRLIAPPSDATPHDAAQRNEFFVYGLQSVSYPTGPIKIGFSAKPIDRLLAHEPGALGERLHIVFQVIAGLTYSDGRRAEKAYHDRFAPQRLNREWFRFTEEMLTWLPDGSRRVYRKTRSPASNTIAATLNSGDLSIFRQPRSLPSPPSTLPQAGDLSAAAMAQTIVQRKCMPRRRAP